MLTRTKIPITVIGFAALAWLQLAPAPASAQGQESQRERGSIVIGTFITNRNTNARVDSNTGNPGTDVDLEGDLGLEASTSVTRGGGYFWLTHRQRIDVSYFDLSRTASRKINETINFDDKTFQINTVVTTDNHLTITKVDYTFAFLNKDTWYLGVTGGLYVMSMGLSLSEPTLGTYSSEGLTAPLPVVGLRSEYAFGKHWNLRGAFQWFGIETDGAGGHLTDTYLGVDYGLGKRWAVGLAYDTVSMGIDVNKTGHLNGSLDWGYNGWLAYFKVDFGGGVSKR
jgi:hypothetical protein